MKIMSLMKQEVIKISEHYKTIYLKYHHSEIKKIIYSILETLETNHIKY